MNEPMYALNPKANPCTCGHGAAFHYASGEPEFVGVIEVKRSRCHATEIGGAEFNPDSYFTNVSVTQCPCTSYDRADAP